MKSVLKVALFLPFFLGMLMLLGSNTVVAGLECCGVSQAATEEIGAPASVEAVPTSVTANPGEVHTVHVTVLDKDKRPVPNVLVTASSDTPNRASVEPEEVKTDEKGMAVFTVKGVAYVPGSTAIITFKAREVEDTIETVFQPS
ncbi:MAG: Ig-like domain-containing protein [Candidatus Brocadiales bacterium]|nr:Ig-like domain-containing protein [Candidatus Brocadiales bacterium]